MARFIPLFRRWFDHRAIAGAALLCLAGCYSGSGPGGASRTLGSRNANGGEAVLGADGDLAGEFGCDVDDDLAGMARQVVTLINLERAKMGVDPLVVDDELTVAAESYACEMAAQDFFDHINPATGEGPADRADEVGYEFFSVGENLAAGQPTAADAVEGWMNSPGHRSNLLSPEWRETGVGVRRGGTYRIYWVQEFGKPARLRQVFGDGPLTSGG